MIAPSQNSAGIDKERLYGEYLRGRREDKALMLKVAHKALDIDEDMNIDARKTSGIGAGGIAAIVGASTLGPLALAAAMFFKQPAAEVPKPVEKVVEKIWDSSVEMEVEPPRDE